MRLHAGIMDKTACSLVNVRLHSLLVPLEVLMQFRTCRFTLLFVLGLLAVPLLSDAQQTAQVYRIGWLGPYYPGHITASLD
jgi:hypothetical protein